MQSDETTPQSRPFADRGRRLWIAGLCLLCGILITLQAWAGRFEMSPDGISYLDMADRLAHSDFSPLLHLYWSPLYPCLLAIVLKLFPGAEVEFQAVHFANWLIGLALLGSFTFFLSAYLSAAHAAKGARTSAAAAFRCRTGFAYMLFLWAALEAVGMASVTPDLLVSAIAYLAAGLWLRFKTTPRQYTTALLLGATLGIGCLAKAAMAPLGFLLLALAAILPGGAAAPRRRVVAVAGLAMLAIFGPYVLALSWSHGRFTAGEAGRLNYAWVVQGGIPIHAGWIGIPPSSGTPVHGPRLLTGDLPILEYKGAAPGGTLPIWYDPAYFHEGLRTEFNIRKQLVVLASSVKGFRLAFGTIWFLLPAGLLALVGWAAPRREAWGKIFLQVPVLWSIGAFAMYALVQVQPRYIAPFMVLFLIGVFDGLSGERLRRVSLGVMTAMALLILFTQANVVVKSSMASSVERFTSLEVARELHNMGLRPGDEIATEGGPFSLFFARLGRFRIVANAGWPGYILAVDQRYQPIDASNLAGVKQRLRSLRIKAVVSPAAHVGLDSWRQLGKTGYSVLLLDEVSDY